MSNQESPKFGRTPWDVLLELSGRRSFLIWACLIGWGSVAAGVLGWYHGALPHRGGSATPSYHLHWSIHPTSADQRHCSVAARSVQSGTAAKETEEHINLGEAFILGIDAPYVSAVGCTGPAGGTLSMVFVAGPTQTGTQNKERSLRKLLDAELPRPQ